MLLEMDITDLIDLPPAKADKAMGLLHTACLQGVEVVLGDYHDMGPLPLSRLSLHASNRWHIAQRWRGRKPKWRSVAEVLQNPPGCIAKLLDQVDSPETRKAIVSKLRSYSYIPSQFNPFAAAAVYRTFAPAGASVLDPCAGWGDRLAAAMGCPSVTRYTGFDANSANLPGYIEQIARYGDPDRHSVKHAAFEDVLLPDQEFDLVFTSPPYVRAEIYSGDPEQSHYRYKSYPEWVEGFLRPLISKSYAALKTGACLVLNIANGYYDTGRTYCDLVSDSKSLAEGLGFVPVGTLTLPMAGHKHEPVLIWMKQ